MNREEMLNYVCLRGEELTLEYLQDESNYPVINGERAFIDNETHYEHSKRNISRNTDHLIESWRVHFWEDKEFKWEITNTKFVGIWNLLNLLENGTSTYIVPPDKKKMTYWSRYKNQWYFNMQSRSGIGLGFTYAMNELMKDAALHGFATAMGEVIDDLED